MKKNTKKVIPRNCLNFRISQGDSKVVDEGDVTKAICDRITGLSKEQREICATHPDAMVAVGDGIHLAMNECQRQFRDHRWNCTIVGKRSTFGYIFLVGKLLQRIFNFN